MANGKTILVVDDDPCARYLLQFILAKTGCAILTAVNGAEAVTFATDWSIDLLVTDIMMKGMDGFELVRTLRRMPVYAGLPIIMLSARSQIHPDKPERDN